MQQIYELLKTTSASTYESHAKDKIPSLLPFLRLLDWHFAFTKFTDGFIGKGLQTEIYLFFFLYF